MLAEDFEQKTSVDVRLGLMFGTSSALATHAFSSLSRPSLFQGYDFRYKTFECKRPKCMSLVDIYRPWSCAKEDGSPLILQFLQRKPQIWAALLRPEYHTWHSHTKKFHKELSESVATVHALMHSGFFDRTAAEEAWHAVDLCCGKSLTSALLSLDSDAPKAITAVDWRDPSGLPHHEEALARDRAHAEANGRDGWLENNGIGVLERKSLLLRPKQASNGSKRPTGGHREDTAVEVRWKAMSDQAEKVPDYEKFLETCLGGSLDDAFGHDKRVFGPGLKDAICELPEVKEDSDSKDEDTTKKKTTEMFELNDSDNESSGLGSDDDDDEWDLEDAYNFDPEKLAELLQKGEVDEEELVESMQESMAEAMMLRMNVEDSTVEAERPDCTGTLDGRMTPPAKDAKDFDAATPPDPKVLAEKLEMKDRRRSSIAGRRNINDAVKTHTARTRKSIACIAAEKTAAGEDKAKIDLAAEKVTTRHRKSLCKAAETLDMAGMGDLGPEAVNEWLKKISKCLMVARGRHRMTVAAAVKETICGESDEEETKTAKAEGSEEAKGSQDGPESASASASATASAPKATAKPKIMSKLRACAKEFQPSEKQLSIKQKIAAAVAAAHKRNGPVEKPQKSEVKEEWITANEDMSLYGYDYSWQGQYGCDGSYGWNQMGEVKEEWTTANKDMSLYGYADYSWQGQHPGMAVMAAMAGTKWVATRWVATKWDTINWDTTRCSRCNTSRQSAWDVRAAPNGKETNGRARCGSAGMSERAIPVEPQTEFA
eukprot:s1012_g2.t3